MPVIETYSARKRRAQRSDSDVYEFNRVPDQLRVQTANILSRALGNDFDPHRYYSGSHLACALWAATREAVAHELGRRSLAGERDAREDCMQILLQGREVDEWLDVVELALRTIERIVSSFDELDLNARGIRLRGEAAVEETNFRFREWGFGYKYEDGQIFRVDSELLHAELTKPALSYLRDARFEGAEQEFRDAHAHYQKGECKDAIVDANSAFESTLKAICKANDWTYPAGARATDLLKIMRQHGLLPIYLDNGFDQLAGTLASGLPQVRNNEGSHGMGAEIRVTPDYIARYALHLTATNIQLLVDAQRAREANAPSGRE